MKRTPIRRVSKKRAKQLAIYSVKRKKYLLAHPWCEAYCKRFGLDYAEVLAHNGVYCEITPVEKMRHWRKVPFSTDIHHVGGRTGDRLNDDFKWLAVSREQHQWIHEHAGQARELGLITD